jgi:hypothetical protein
VLGSAGILATASALLDWHAAVWAGKVLSSGSRETMFTPHLQVSIGNAGYGVFVNTTPDRGRQILARGYEDWGANAVLSHWPDHGVAIAVITSTGPAESTGHPGWSRTLSAAIADHLLPGPSAK